MIGDVTSYKSVQADCVVLGRAPASGCLISVVFSEEQKACFSLVLSNVKCLLIHTAKGSLSVPNYPQYSLRLSAS